MLQLNHGTIMDKYYSAGKIQYNKLYLKLKDDPELSELLKLFDELMWEKAQVTNQIIKRCGESPNNQF